MPKVPPFFEYPLNRSIGSGTKNVEGKRELSL
jgi:hypothetical protein